jgi:tetratricopeptide (TPR) repeat protein
MRALWVRSTILMGLLAGGPFANSALAQAPADPALSPEQEANVRRLLERPRAAVGPAKRTARVEGAVRRVSDPPPAYDETVPPHAHDWFSVPPYGSPYDRPSVSDRARLLPKPEHARRGYEPLEETERLYPGPHRLGNEAPRNGPTIIGGGTFGSPFIGPTADDAIRMHEYMQRRTRDASNADDMRTRRDRVLKRADRAIEQGRAMLREGQYRQAAMMLRLASDLDQGDPGVRLYLAAALLGAGRYEEGGAALRRALSLQPKLVNVPVDWTRDFASEEELKSAVSKLRTHCLGDARTDTAPAGETSPAAAPAGEKSPHAAPTGGAAAPAMMREAGRGPADVPSGDDAITVRSRGGRIEIATRSDDRDPRSSANERNRLSRADERDRLSLSDRRDRLPHAGPNALVLLGYVAYQQGDDATAYEALWEAWQSGVRDDAIRALLDITRPE